MKKFLVVFSLILGSLSVVAGGFLLGSYIGNARKASLILEKPKEVKAAAVQETPKPEVKTETKPKEDDVLPFGEIDDRKFRDLTLGMDYTEIVKTLGKPQYEKKVYTDVFGSHKDVNYSFGKLKFDEQKGKFLLKSIIITSYAVEGPRKIKLGETVESVLKKFPDKNQPPKGTQRWLYGNEHSKNGVVSYDKKAKIVEVNYYSEPGRTDTSGLRLKIRYNKVTEMELWLENIN